jgi:PadR family transcriptional regulator PadR
MARRKPGSLVAIEREILDVALSLRRSGEGTFHGFGLAQRLRERSDARSLTGHGTLYKALGRLEELGLLRSQWEEPVAEGRPRRRLYELTVEGAYVASRARAGASGEPATVGKPNTTGRAAPEPA